MKDRVSVAAEVIAADEKAKLALFTGKQKKHLETKKESIDV